MNWEHRLRALLFAGGTLTVVGCSSTSSSDTVPCGNANPDPCICGKPEQSATLAALCDQEKACQAKGGAFVTTTNGETDGGTEQTGLCTLDAGADADASAEPDAAP